VKVPVSVCPRPPGLSRHSALREYNSSEQAERNGVNKWATDFLAQKERHKDWSLPQSNRGGLRYKVKEIARKISTLAISSWHFPK
jgi:hypothetical protein